MESRYPIMDESGKAAEWLAAGRGIAIWSSRLIGEYAPDKLTPGDVTEAPGWRYTGRPDCILGPDDVLFYRKSNVATAYRPEGSEGYVNIRGRYSATPAGYKAAERNVPAPYYVDAPIGRVYHRFTVEYVTYESTEKRGDGRPVDYLSHHAIIEWTAIDSAFVYSGPIRPFVAHFA